MNVMRSIFHYEWLLLLRNKFMILPLIINVLAWGYVIISYEIQPVKYEERAAIFYNGFPWIVMLNLILIGLFAVYIASKDDQNHFEQLAMTYEVKNSEWLIGKWLVAQLYGIAISVITLIVQAVWFLFSTISIGDWAKHCLYVFIQIEGALFLIISLGFLFAVLIKNIFAYVFIPVILVLSLTLPFDNVGTASTFDNPRFHLLTPFDFMFIGTPYEGIWGIHRVFDETVVHQIAVFLFGVFLILVTILLFRLNRMLEIEKKVLPFLIGIFFIIAILLSGNMYFQYDQALKQYIATGKQYVKAETEENGFYKYHLDDINYNLSIEETELVVDLQPSNQLAVKSILSIKNIGNSPANEIYLTLNHQLKITECSSSEAITCTRDKDFITVLLNDAIKPNEQLALSLYYSGNILQYRDDAYVEHSFIESGRIYLPKEAGWYPLIGKRQLVVAREHDKRYAQFEMRNGRLLENSPTKFTVEINRKPSQIPLTLTVPKINGNTYKGASQYGLSLVGGHLIEDSVGQIRIVAHPDVLHGAKETVKKYEKVWTFIEEWLEVPMIPSVIYILNEEHAYYTWNTRSQEFRVWESGDLKYVDDTIIAYETILDLTSEYIVWENNDLMLLKEAMEWVILNRNRQTLGFKQSYLARWSPLEDTKLIDALHAFEEKSVQEFNNVIKFLYEQYDELENKQDFNMEVSLRLYEGATKK